MTAESALRWLGITPWGLRPGVVPRYSPVEPAPSLRASPASLGSGSVTLESVTLESVNTQPVSARSPVITALLGEAVLPQAEVSSATLWVVNVAPEAPLVAAIIRALPASWRWQVTSFDDGAPAVRVDGAGAWILADLQSDGKARRALWRQLHHLTAR